MKILHITALALLASGLGACANVRGPAPAALAYYASPVAIGPVGAAQPSKRGEACANNFLGMFAMGDASIDAAKQSAGITKVASVEQSASRVLGYYAKYCTIVRGE